MGLYRFLFRGLALLHVGVGVLFLVALALLALTGHITTFDQLGREATTALLAYAFFLLGIGVAIGSKLHRFVREPALDAVLKDDGGNA